MGYYTNVVVELKVKPEKKNEFLQKLSEYKENSPDWFKNYADLSLGDDGSISFEESYRVWRYSDDFNELVKCYVEKGKITCEGEGFEDYWRVVFDGKGNWQEQTPSFVPQYNDLLEYEPCVHMNIDKLDDHSAHCLDCGQEFHKKKDEQTC